MLGQRDRDHIIYNMTDVTSRTHETKKDDPLNVIWDIWLSYDAHQNVLVLI